MTKHKFRIQTSTNNEKLPEVIHDRIDTVTSNVDIMFDGIQARIIPEKVGGVQPRHQYLSFSFEGTNEQLDNLQTEITNEILHDNPWYVTYYSDIVDSDGKHIDWSEKVRYGNVPNTF